MTTRLASRQGADANDLDADTLALRRLNTNIAMDERWDRVLLPIASEESARQR